jgi:hypothetical protein
LSITKQNGESTSSFCITLLHTVWFKTEISVKPSVLSPVSSIWSVVFSRLGDSSVSEFYVPMFWNTISHLHRSCSYKFKRLGITQKKYTTFTTWWKFEIKKEYGLSDDGHKRLKHPGVTTTIWSIN